MEWELEAWEAVYRLVEECWTPQYPAAVNMMGTMVPVSLEFATHFNLLGAICKVLVRDDGLVPVDKFIVMADFDWIEWSTHVDRSEVLKSIRRRMASVNYQLN